MGWAGLLITEPPYFRIAHTSDGGLVRCAIKPNTNLDNEILCVFVSSSPRQPRTSQTVLSRMQLTLHATRRTPHVVPRLVQAMSAWSVKTRRLPSRHCKDARAYGHTTTAMHDMSTPPPALPPPFRSWSLSPGWRDLG